MVTFTRALVTFSLVVSGTIKEARQDAARYRRSLSSLLHVPMERIELSLSSASVRMQIRITPLDGTRAQAEALAARATVRAVLGAAQQLGIGVQTIVAPTVIVEVAVASTPTAAPEDEAHLRALLAGTLTPCLLLLLLVGGCCYHVRVRRHGRVARADMERLQGIAVTRAYCHAHPGLANAAASTVHGIHSRVRLTRKARVHIGSVEVAAVTWRRVASPARSPARTPSRGTPTNSGGSTPRVARVATGASNGGAGGGISSTSSPRMTPPPHDRITIIARQRVCERL